MRRLAVHVHVHDDQGVAHVFAPGDTLPGWAAERITNPKVWATDDDVPADTPPPADDPGHDSGAESPVNPLLTGDPEQVAAWVAAANVDDVLAALGELPAEAQAPVAEFLAAVEGQRDKPRKTLLEQLAAITAA